MERLISRTGLTLGALTLLVTGAHLWALQWSGQDWLAPTPSAPRVSLQTRSVTAPPTPHTTPAAQAAKPAAPKARPAPTDTQHAVAPALQQAEVMAPAAPQVAVEQAPPPAQTAPDTKGSTASATPHPVVIPSSMTLRYDVQGTAKGLQYHASSELQYQHNGQQYEARLSISAFLIGSRSDMSQGNLGSAGLEPVRYAMKSRSERAAHFVRDKGLITFSSNRPDAVLQPGAQDRLSVLIQLASILAADPKTHQPGSKLGFQVASADSATLWQFTVEGPENIELPSGVQSALRLVRQPRTEYDQRVEVWMSDQVSWMPVRIRITQANGDTVDQLLRNAQP